MHSRLLKYRLLFFIVSLGVIPVLFAYVPKDMESRLIGKQPILGKMTLLTPPIAENSAEVGITITNIELPGPDIWVKEVLLYVPYNNKPIAKFSSRNQGLSSLRMRIRVRGSTTVYAYAVLSNGNVLGASKEVKITLGGCGGDGGGSYTSYTPTYHSPNHQHAHSSTYSNYPSQQQTKSPQRSNERYDKFANNRIFQSAEVPLSTFSVDVDTGSYTNVRRFIEREGRLPTRDAVRIEEMLNYFDYSYEAPSSRKTPFAVHTEVAPTPWNKHSQLLRIGIKGYEVNRSHLPAANLVFLIDVSGSMSPPDRLPLVLASLKMLVNQLGGRDRVAIVVYSGATGLVLPSTPGSDKKSIIAALERLHAGGSTNGGDGIHLAYLTAQQAFIKGGINRVIIATDGDFNVGVVNHEDLIALVKQRAQSGITLTTLGVGRGNYNDKLMEQLANQGNGNHAYIDTLKEAHRLLVQQLHSTLYTIAKDVKVQVEFNPKTIAAYRLIGYENRVLKREDFKNDKVDAGDLGAGHTVTALFEIYPAGSNDSRIDSLRYQDKGNGKTNTQELAFVKLRYKLPDEDHSRPLEYKVTREQTKTQLESASLDFRFAAAVAAFGQVLRANPHVDGYSYDQIIALAKQAQGADTRGYRREFVQLVEFAKALVPQVTQQ